MRVHLLATRQARNPQLYCTEPSASRQRCMHKETLGGRWEIVDHDCGNDVDQRAKLRRFIDEQPFANRQANRLKVRRTDSIVGGG